LRIIFMLKALAANSQTLALCWNNLLFTPDRSNNYTYFTKITHEKEVLYPVYPYSWWNKIGYAHSQHNFGAT